MPSPLHLPRGTQAYRSVLTLALLALAIFSLAVRDPLRIWLGDAEVIPLLIGWASLYALGLAVTHFRAAVAVWISLLMALGIGILLVGRILPAPVYLVNHTIIESLWLMNIRLTTFFEQIGLGMGQALSGTFPEAPFLAFVIAVVTWHVIHWQTWRVVRHHEAWSGILLSLALLLGCDRLAARQPEWPMGLTLVGIVLAARVGYASTVRSWENRALGYPELVWENWALGAATITTAVMLLTGLSTPEWRDSIQDYIDRLRRSDPASVVAPPASPDTGAMPPAGSFVPDLSTVGAPLATGDEILMFVTTNEPPTGVESSGYTMPPAEKHYWRGSIYARYTGSGWELADLESRGMPAADLASPPEGRQVLRQDFEILAAGGNQRFASSQPASASHGIDLLPTTSDPLSTVLRGLPEEYSVVSWTAQVSQEALRQAGTDVPEATRAAYLQLPERLPQRVRNLARRVTLGAATPYDKALRIQEYLRASYPYELDVPGPPPDRDVVDYFLFDSRSGFCSYFASAMAVMLRSEGVPARVVTGFATGEWDGQANRYRVPIAAAHAWVEVFFPTYGWIEFEPTPSLSVFDYLSAESAAGPIDSPGIGQQSRTDRAPAILSVVAVALALAVGFAVKGLWSRPRSVPLEPGVRLHGMYWGMRRNLTPDGADGTSNLTPLEYLQRCEVWLGRAPRLGEAVRTLTGLYMQATYSPHGPIMEEVERSLRLWRSAWWQRAKWMARRRVRDPRRARSSSPPPEG